MNAPSPLSNTPYKIVRIYLKGASSEVPDMAAVPRQAISPHVGVDMQTLAAPAWPGALECVLRISLHARLEGKTVFMIEVSEAGVFELDISDMEEAHRFVRKIAPSVLFPFARRDLASLTVAAGFQPVLLDHIDFDTMLAQVMKSQRLTRTAAPMRLDVIAAKPVAQVAPVPVSTPLPMPVAVSASAPEANQETAGAPWFDTQPAPLSAAPPAAQITAQTPMRADTAAERELPLMASRLPSHDQAFGPRSKPKLRNKALVLLGIVGVGVMIAWWAELKRSDTNGTTVASNTKSNIAAKSNVAPKAPAAAASKAALPAAPAAPVVPLASAETLRAIDLSRERLADQPASWFTLDLGLGPVDTPLASWLPAAADRPMFVKAAKDGSVRLLYGVFPSKAAAEQVKTEMTRPATVVTIGSL